MALRLRHRLLLGGGATSFSYAGTMLIQLLSVPLFLKYWGVPLYGTWLIMSSIPAYFTLTDVGFSSVTGNDMAMKLARGDREGALSAFQSSWVLLSGISTGILLIILPVLWFCPIERWLNLTAVDHVTAIATMTLLLLHAAVYLQGALLSAAYRSVGLYARSTVFASVVQLLNFGGLALAVILGWGPIGAATAYLGVRLIAQITYYNHLRSHSSWIVFGTRHASASTLRKLTAPALSFCIFPLGSLISGQGIVTLLGISAGPVGVVTFTTVRTLTNATRQLISVVNNTVWPEFSAAFGANNLLLAQRLHRYSCHLTQWTAILVVGFLGVGGHWVIVNWTKGTVNPDHFFLWTMLLAALANAFWSTSAIVLMATNQHQQVALRYLIATVCCVIAAAVLLRLLGLPGVALALALMEITMAAIVLKNSFELLGDRLVPFILSFISFPLMFVSSGIQHTKLWLRAPRQI